MIDPKIFKAYDIRGIYPSEINEEVVYKVGRAFYTFFCKKLGKNKLSIVVGGDMRLSTPALFEKLKQALVDSGAEVIDIGVVPTPTVYFAVRYLNADGGIQVSASHNPKEYNGLKAVMNMTEGLVKIGKNTGMGEVKRLADEGEFVESGEMGSITKKDVMADDVANAFEVIKPGEIKPLTVVADAANAMGSPLIEALFEKLPSCKLIKMNFELDGTFPAHQADPLQFDTLKDLCARVVEEKADFGIAPDGDGDRVFFIDERGEVVPASISTAIIIRELLKKYPGEKVGFDIRYIWSPTKAALDGGGVPVITQVGHALITETMQKEHLFYAGESSGHNYWRFAGGAESTIAVILTILDTISREGKKMSEIVKEVSASFESGEINFKLDSADEAKNKIELFKETFNDGEVSLIDGLSVAYDDWRFNLRASNTEPLIRLNIEARSKDLMEKRVEELRGLIEVK